MKATSLPILLMIGAVFCFASMDATAKYLMKEIGPAQTIWARYTVQALIVTVLILPKNKCLWENKLSKTSVFKIRSAHDGNHTFFLCFF